MAGLGGVLCIASVASAQRTVQVHAFNEGALFVSTDVALRLSTGCGSMSARLLSVRLADLLARICSLTRDLVAE